MNGLLQINPYPKDQFVEQWNNLFAQRFHLRRIQTIDPVDVYLGYTLNRVAALSLPNRTDVCGRVVSLAEHGSIISHMTSLQK